MENKSKCYVLVAWTRGGQLRMIPSLVKECSVVSGTITDSRQNGPGMCIKNVELGTVPFSTFFPFYP